MRSLAFNSVENEFCENIGGPDDLVKWRVDIKNIIQEQKYYLFTDPHFDKSDERVWSW